MDRFHIDDMVGGWFVGDFEPAALRTAALEVCYKRHAKGEHWPAHYHAIATEVSCVVRGAIQINGVVFKEGDIFVIHPGEVSAPEFLADCELIVIKTPSVPGDKYEV